MNRKVLRENRAQRVMRNAKAAEARRRDCAQQFRSRLIREIPGDGAARESLIEAAVSAHVEVTELSRRFLQCRASADAMARLSLCRGQLSRILRQLGLTAGPAEPQDEPAGAALEEWARERLARQQTANASVPVPSDGQS